MILYDTFALDGVRRTADGYLAAFARVARTGIQVYKGSELGRPDLGEVRVYRPPEEVFHTDALRSFAHRPVTLKHPPVPVTAKNWKKYGGGQTGDQVVRDGEFIRVPMVMMDQKLIDAYERDGVKELSMGYSTDIQWRTGVVDAGQPDAGQSYDAVQTAIRGNHLAVVPLARGGDRLRIGDGRRKSLAFDIENDFRTLIDRINNKIKDPDDDEDPESEAESEDYVDDGGETMRMYDTDFTTEQREKLAKSGAAMPGGGFPIRNAEDLHHAMEAIGRAKDPDAARAHIRERAKVLGLESELSASFKDAALGDAWSDEARAAAIEARRLKSKGKLHGEYGAALHNVISRGAPQKIRHGGKAYYHTGKVGTNFKTGEYSAEYRNSDDGQDDRVWHTVSGKTIKDSSSTDDVDYVDCPQCGAEIPADTGDCPSCGYHVTQTKDGDITMKRIMIDGVPVDVSDDQGAAIIDRHVISLTKQATDAVAKATTAQTALDAATSSVSAKDGEIAVLKKQLADAQVTPAKLDEMVKDRLAVIDAATPLLDKSYVFDGKSIVDIKRAAVDAYLGDAAKGMDEGAIAGAFIAATMDAKKAGGGSQPIRRALFQGGRQPVADTRQTAYDERMERLKNAYKKPVTA